MGKLKQLHIDCTPQECIVNQPETCYMLEQPKRYKVAYEGLNIVEIEANSAEEAEDKFFEDGHNDLYNAQIVETVEADQPFEMYTDLN